MDALYIANGVAVLAVIVPGYFAWKNSKKKQEEIHVLVNARLSEALQEIKDLKVELVKGETAIQKVKRAARVAEAKLGNGPKNPVDG